MSSHDSDASGIVTRKGKNRREDEKVVFMEGFKEDPEAYERIKTETLAKDDHCEVIPIDDKEKPNIIPEVLDDSENCCEKPNKYYNKIMKIMLKFDDCTTELSFNIDKDMVLETVETSNVYDFKLLINGELMNLDNDVKFYKDDEITVRISRDDLHADSELYLIGYDPNTVFDKTDIAESSLDEPIDEEHIMINYDEN
jgi:hypothetical protein